MTQIIYPPVMGLFCTGYVLHLIWQAWKRRQANRFLSCWNIQNLDNRLEIIWAQWDAAERSDSPCL